MAKEPPVYLIRRDLIEELNVDAVLDMLRYDGARVECNAPSGYYMFSNAHGPCEDRWRSFGIDSIHCFENSADAWAWVRRQKKEASHGKGA